MCPIPAHSHFFVLHFHVLIINHFVLKPHHIHISCSLISNSIKQKNISTLYFSSILPSYQIQKYHFFFHNHIHKGFISYKTSFVFSSFQYIQELFSNKFLSSKFFWICFYFNNCFHILNNITGSVFFSPLRYSEGQNILHTFSIEALYLLNFLTIILPHSIAQNQHSSWLSSSPFVIIFLKIFVDFSGMRFRFIFSPHRRLCGIFLF